MWDAFHFLWFEPALRFRVSLEFCVRGLQSGLVQSRGGFGRLAHGGRCASGRIITVETRDSEFRHPQAVAFLESLTDEQAAKQPPLILEQDGVAAQHRREGGRVRCREFATDGASGDPASERRSTRICWRCATPRFRLCLARVAASEWSGTDVPGRRARRASVRSGSSGAIAIAATVAAASTN